MGLLVVLVIAEIFVAKGLAFFRVGFTPPRVCAVILAKQSRRPNPVVNGVGFVPYLAALFAGCSPSLAPQPKDGTYPKNIPPFTWMFCPVMKLAPGPQRKRTAAAMSEGSPRRPTSACTSE